MGLKGMRKMPLDEARASEKRKRIFVTVAIEDLIIPAQPKKTPTI